VQRTEGYFYLLPSGDRMGRRHMSAGEMLVGQVLALMFLDPSTLPRGGVVARELVLQRLSNLVATDVLMRTLNPQKKKYDERIAAEVVRTKVAEALRKLQDLGFADLLEDEVSLRLRPALMRFADPVRGLEDPADALAKLVAKGEVVLGAVEAPADDEEPAT
jgi:chromosome partition protein MukE